jgi:hypothetical protein
MKDFQASSGLGDLNLFKNKSINPWFCSPIVLQ